jgi:hypothetical protein
MKVFIVILFFLVSCGDPRQNSSTSNAYNKPSLGSLINQQKVAVDKLTCQSGKGVIINTGVDKNRNGLLDSTEVDQTSIVCDGAEGANGIDGKDGVGVVFAQLDATIDQCPSGGRVLVIASDTENIGQYSNSSENKQSIVTCNGSPGKDTSFDLLTAIAPCGMDSEPGLGKEILLCLSDGSVISSFSDNASGKNTRLAFIPLNVQLQDTDGSLCIFMATKNENNDTIIQWNPGSNGKTSWLGGSQVCKKNTNTTIKGNL